MSLSDLASIGSFVSGLAVIATLLFLVVQIRQTEKNQRALINQGSVNRMLEGVHFAAQPEHAALSARVIAGETRFTADELYRLGRHLRALVLSNQEADVQRRERLIHGMHVDNTVTALRTLLAQPVYRALWLEGRYSYAPEMIAFVDALVAETPLVGPRDVVASFEQRLAEATGAAVSAGPGASADPRPGHS